LASKSTEEKLAQYEKAMSECQGAITTLTRAYDSGAALLKSLEEKGFSVTDLLHEDENAQDLTVQVSTL